MRRIVLTAVLLSGCQSITEPPTLVETYHQPYDRLSECFYSGVRVGLADEAGIRHEDLKAHGVAIVGQRMRETPIWEARFIRISANSTRVEVKAMPTIWGHALYSEKVYPYLQACA
ncbi:MAG: hypothetical protein U1E25_14625 [Methylocystis sp.]